MENTFKTKITDILDKPAEKLASARGLHVLRIQVRGTESIPVIELLLDGDRLVSIDDCESVSRDLTTLIDDGSLVKGNYRLDVMSPGLEEPIVQDWQFHRSVGHLVEAHYEDHGEHHTVHGHLCAYSAKEIEIVPIHVKANKPTHPKAVITDEGPVTLQTDEQLYVAPVALVKIERKHLKKVMAQPEFGK